MFTFFDRTEAAQEPNRSTAKSFRPQVEQLEKRLAPVANPVFGIPITFALGNNPTAVAPGDFNGDGKLDLAVVTVNSGQGGSVNILLGDGTGSFLSHTTFDVGTSPISPSSLTAEDFNGDGKLDLAIANTGSGDISIVLGDGTGGFSPAASYPATAHPGAIGVGDFNGDGKLDLVVTDNGGSTISVLLGNGAGGFSAPTMIAVGGNPISVGVGDFNGDGKPDLAVANNLSNSISILLCNGAGGFSAPINFPTGLNPSSVTVDDFNADGALDLAVNNAGSNNVSILLGDGAGGFSLRNNFDAGDAAGSLATGDFNRDGKLDVALVPGGNAFPGPQHVNVLLGDGNGNLGLPISYPVGGAPVSVATGDFDGTGSPDLAMAVVGTPGSNVTVLLNQTAQVAGVDLVGSIDNGNLVHHIYVTQHLTVPVRVTNQGSARATGSLSISFFLSTSTTLDASAVRVPALLNNLLIDLGNSLSQTFQAQVRIPRGILPGDYYLLALVNSTNSIAESDVSNNLAASQKLILCSSTALTSAQAMLYDQAVSQARQSGPPALLSGPPLSDAGMNYTTVREGGLIPFPYLDSAGIPTIGIGLNIRANRARLQSELGLTDRQINQLIQEATANGTVQPDGTLTSGNQPVGVGIISVDQLRALFAETYLVAQSDAQGALQDNGVNWSGLGINAQVALTDMAFNLGRKQFAKFMPMFQDLSQDDLACAGFEMMRTRWAVQVQSRAILDFRLLVTGSEQQL